MIHLVMMMMKYMIPMDDIVVVAIIQLFEVCYDLYITIKKKLYIYIQINNLTVVHHVCHILQCIT